MKALIQRVSEASVTVSNQKTSEIAQGLLVLLGIGNEDTEEDMNWLINKILNLRIFNDDSGVMNRSLLDVNGEIIVVSQFTLMANTKKGNRPSYINAAKPDISEPLYEKFVGLTEEKLGQKVGTGIFGADMKVALVNDGPVTIILDTENK